MSYENPLALQLLCSRFARYKMVKKMGWVTMVKRIKRAQKGLASTTSLRCYWSVRVNLYDVASVCSVLRCYLYIEKDAEAYAKEGF